jgi:hypothetical protein
MNRRSAFVCALAGLLVGCGGTVPLLSVVDAQDEVQGDDAQGSSSDGPTDAATGDATADAASDAGGDVAADSAIDATADAQDEVWRVNPACVNQTCVSGTCIGVCSAGSTQCSNGGVQTCTSSGSWGTAVPCEGGTCAGGVCTPSADAAID